MVIFKVFIDFEFNRIKNPNPQQVCVAYIDSEGRKGTFWFHNFDEGKQRFREKVKEWEAKQAVMVAWVVSAEARSFLALEIEPLKFNWIDLYLEYRLITNKCDHWMYGKQLLKGVPSTTCPPPWGSAKIKGLNYSNPQHSLAAGTYKLLGVTRDTQHKDDMRNLIISDPEEFNTDEREAILRYCLEDVIYLPDILEKVLSATYNLYQLTNKEPYDKHRRRDERYLRGEYGARTAYMERLGYPIDNESTARFTANVGDIIKACVEDILSQELPVTPFKWNKKEGRYSECQKDLKTYFKMNYKSSEWKLTDSKQYSLSLDAFAKHCHDRHDFKRDDIIAQMLRYKKLLQHLNGFRPKGENAKNKEVFKDSIGGDGRVRTRFGIYGSQSGRSQPKATSFIPLKAAWMRVLILPKRGRAICSTDYGSQEFLLSAIISGDRAMYEGYVSGDPYLYFAKQAGAVPEEGTKKSHAKERTLFKSTTLGISYNMGAEALAAKLSRDVGETYTKAQAQELIDLFFSVFSKFKGWNDDNSGEYYEGKKPIEMLCGWTMWRDNKNWRSVNNVPIQGAGASIMRKAVALAQDAGLDVIYTLHDALYVEYDYGDLNTIDILRDCMLSAFCFYFEGEYREWASKIRMDSDTWGLDYVDGEVITPDGTKVKTQTKYIDERSVGEYNYFKEYL